MSVPRETQRVQLTYPPEIVTEPILYHLVVDHGLIPNIRRANMDARTGGFIVLELTGEPEALDRGIRFLEGCGIEVSVAGVDASTEWTG
jgi:hypothetical protein